MIWAPDKSGRWQKTKLQRYGFRLGEVAQVETGMPVRPDHQRQAKKQKVTVLLY